MLDMMYIVYVHPGGGTGFPCLWNAGIGLITFKGSSENYHSGTYSVALSKFFFMQLIGFFLLLKWHIYIT